ncbi:MAG: DNA-binding transcriptional LysR family regulator [Myxococcota bacterium]|jgi:DNA-binding transcriptional LysR family regulator
MQSGMQWRSIGFNWNHARTFLVTAEEGSFSAAGRVMGVAQPTVGRQVAAFEEELGVTLFERVGNTLALTETGLELLEHIRAMAEAATKASLAAAGQAMSLEGSVSITASELYSVFILPPIIAALRLVHPGIEIELVASNDARDLLRREADIAVRNFAPTQPELFARKIGDRFARLYATPAYLERLGPVRSPADLSKAEFFGFDRSALMIDGLQTFGIALGQENFPIVTSNHLVQWALALQGAGICIVMEEVGDAEPRVCRVLDDLPPIPIPVWLTCHRELRTSRRIRVVFDFLAEALQRDHQKMPSAEDGSPSAAQRQR